MCQNGTFPVRHLTKTKQGRGIMKKFFLIICIAAGTTSALAQYTPTVHGTVRSKYEYQTEEGEGRFMVRTARVSLDGKVVEKVSYKAEIDLCDEGNIKMLDAYVRITPFSKFDFTIGQMRVPFTIDAHRSPHQQYFANRSFIAKQVGNVRDVGATVGYTFKGSCPVTLQAGLFNGSGLSNQKDFWTKSVNFSTKAQIMFPKGFNVTLSMQKIRPECCTVMMYDGGAYYHGNGWHIEAEYLYKHYGNNAFDAVNAFDSFISYDFELKKKDKWLIKKITPLVRYDYMDDHSDAEEWAVDDEGNQLATCVVDDVKRGRLTAGVTFGLSTKPFVSDIRLNYEKYFYDDNRKADAAVSERDKVVVEFMVRF